MLLRGPQVMQLDGADGATISGRLDIVALDFGHVASLIMATLNHTLPTIRGKSQYITYSI